MWSRRGFVAAALALCSAPPSRAQQQDRLPVVAWLSAGRGADPLLAAFQRGLRDLGYVEGRSIRVEAGWVEDDPEALRALARELLRHRAEVIVTNGRAATRAAQEATAAIPIVMAPVEDPYEFVPALARPRGNITGLALQQTDIDAKQIEFLREIVPGLSRLAIFHSYGETYYALSSTAHALGIETFWLRIKGEQDVEPAFARAAARKADGLLVVDTPALGAVRRTILRTALALRMPAAASWRENAEPGLLLTYAADDTHLQQRAAAYVDRLLKGARPDELPVEQASKFELILNSDTARRIGVVLPQSVLVRADNVIE